jgi:hypothetical protein
MLNKTTIAPVSCNLPIVYACLSFSLAIIALFSITRWWIEFLSEVNGSTSNMCEVRNMQHGTWMHVTVAAAVRQKLYNNRCRPRQRNETAVKDRNKGTSITVISRSHAACHLNSPATWGAETNTWKVWKTNDECSTLEKFLCLEAFIVFSRSGNSTWIITAHRACICWASVCK